MKHTIEELAICNYNMGIMCKGCFVKMMAPRDLNYKCPIHEVDE